MPKKIDEEIIELTDVVEDDLQTEEVDDFLSDFKDHDLFRQVSPPPPDKQKEEFDDELESFFSQTSSNEIEPPKFTDPIQESEERLDVVPPQSASDEALQSVLKDLVQGIQQDQQQNRSKENQETEETFDLEKQWKTALGSEESGNEAGVLLKPQLAAMKDSGDYEESASSPEAIGATTPSALWDQTISIEIKRHIDQLLTIERVETALVNALRQILEPLAERVLNQAAEKILIQEIERLKADLRNAEEEA